MRQTNDDKRALFKRQPDFVSSFVLLENFKGPQGADLVGFVHPWLKLGAIVHALYVYNMHLICNILNAQISDINVLDEQKGRTRKHNSFPEIPKSLNALWSSRKWDKLLTPHRKINTEVLREFYTNAFPSAGFAFSFSTKVGGRTIHFHRDAINEFLGNPLVLREGQMCRYQESITKVPNVEEIFKENTFEWKRSGKKHI
ncbi:hypothetical protein KIW84_046283 [Lathyrus oleraceus]|uniref:Putative plant transposon protein domain-containing protein n=1 Tax=Pisum sativum TaxID=3888 RepID=A0A9D4XQH5_PEA|nr:hypothetical protein KIW84_046283 [Pisum sativum]